MSRTSGRILGWLMICEPEHQSAKDLVDTLSLSTGSASTQIRMLEQLELVERTSFPGDRVRYFRLPPMAWSKLMQGELARIIEMRKLAEAGMGVLPATRPERVTELASIADFFSEEWPPLLERLEDRIVKETT